MSGDQNFLMSRLTKTRALIVAYEDAVAALVSNRVQSYTLNTGQSTQTVTRYDINTLNESIDRLYNRCSTIEARLGMGNTVLGLPDW